MIYCGNDRGTKNGHWKEIETGILGFLSAWGRCTSACSRLLLLWKLGWCQIYTVDIELCRVNESVCRNLSIYLGGLYRGSTRTRTFDGPSSVLLRTSSSITRFTNLIHRVLASSLFSPFRRCARILIVVWNQCNASKTHNFVLTVSCELTLETTMQ
jgi:hypothetical protein